MLVNCTNKKYRFREREREDMYPRIALKLESLSNMQLWLFQALYSEF